MLCVVLVPAEVAECVCASACDGRPVRSPESLRSPPCSSCDEKETEAEAERAEWTLNSDGREDRLLLRRGLELE